MGKTHPASTMIKRVQHRSVEETSEDVRALEDTKEEKVTFATRAPTSADKGRFWVKYTETSDTTMTIYVRHPRSGTWRSVNVT